MPKQKKEKIRKQRDHISKTLYLYVCIIATCFALLKLTRFLRYTWITLCFHLYLVLCILSAIPRPQTNSSLTNHLQADYCCIFPTDFWSSLSLFYFVTMLLCFLLSLITGYRLYAHVQSVQAIADDCLGTVWSG